MARYIIRASSAGGPIESSEPLTLEVALEKAAELRDAHFQHITLINTRTGVAVTDLEELIRRDT